MGYGNTIQITDLDLGFNFNYLASSDEGKDNKLPCPVLAFLPYTFT